MTTTRHSEAAFESVIEAHLLDNGYVTLKSGFDPKRAIFPQAVTDFIRRTQPKEWARLEALHGKHTATQVLTDLCKWMDTYGSLHTLRHGFKCYGRTLVHFALDTEEVWMTIRLAGEATHFLPFNTGYDGVSWRKHH